MPADSVRLPWWQQFVTVTKLQYSEYRDSAVFLALFSLVMPLGLLWMLGGFVTGNGQDATWFLAGNAMMTVGFGSFNFAVNRMGQMRLQKESDYYAALPVSRSAFVLSLFVLAQVATLPGTLASLVIGHFMLAISWGAIAAALPVALLSAVCLTMVGTAVGTLAKTWGHLNLYGNLIYFVVLFCSPVMRPFRQLIWPLKVTSAVLPTGQAALAMTEALAGRFGPQFWLFTGLLLLWMVLAGVYGLRGLDWRND